jgi:serine/threonine protein phosphatase PrpC
LFVLTGITLNFASEAGDGVIGVYSGHGENGHQCANFSQRVLPQQLAKFVRQKRVQCYTKKLKAEGNIGKKGAWNPNAWPLLSTNDFEQCCQRAFNGTNKMLHEENEVSKIMICEIVRITTTKLKMVTYF